MAKKKARKKKSAPGAYLSIRAYAQHRAEAGLPGKSHTAVRKAIESGRLKACLHREGGKDWIEAPVADREWEENTHAAKRRAKPAGGRPPANLFGDEPPASPRERVADPRTKASMSDAQTMRAIYAAKLTRLEFEQKAGTLCVVAEVESRAFALARSIRDKLLQLPDRMAPVLANVPEDANGGRVFRVRELLETEIQGVLELLADG